MGGGENPAGADEYAPAQEPLSRRPPVLGKDGSLPGVGGDVGEEPSFDAKLRLAVLSQAAGGFGGKDEEAVRPTGLLYVCRLREGAICVAVKPQLSLGGISMPSVVHTFSLVLTAMSFRRRRLLFLAQGCSGTRISSQVCLTPKLGICHPSFLLMFSYSHFLA